MARHHALLRAQKIEVDEPMEFAAMQQAKHLRQRQAGRYSADERRAHRLARQQRNPAPVEHAFGDQLGIGRPRLDLFAACGCLPDLRRRWRERAAKKSQGWSRSHM